MADAKKRLVLDIEFADGKVRTVSPLKISQLRKFMKVANELDTTDSMSEENIDRMMEAAAIILGPIDPELANDREKLEDAIDVEIFWSLFGIAMGNKVEGDPNE
jgi:hypothetical protein